MKEVWVVDGLRSAILKKNGGFSQVLPEDLGAELIRGILKRNGLNEVDSVIGGNAVGTGGNIIRLTALKAGLPLGVPALTVDMQCASGAAAIDIARSRIAMGQDEVILAGGIESASLQPARMYAKGDKRAELTENGIYYTAQFSPDTPSQRAMLEGAERVAKMEHISRNELSQWVIRSHQKAAEAQKRGALRDFIYPINGISKDDGIRPRMNQRLLDRLPRLLGEGTITDAGNACGINDGGAFLLLAEAEWARAHGFSPKARIVTTAMAGGPPEESPRGAMLAADKVLERTGLTYGEMDAIEFNEAFAVIDVLFERRFTELTDRYLRLGGALAYGHPYGASGAILLLHLIRSLEETDGRYGLMAIAGAGGMGEAIIVERMK